LMAQVMFGGFFLVQVPEIFPLRRGAGARPVLGSAPRMLPNDVMANPASYRYATPFAGERRLAPGRWKDYCWPWWFGPGGLGDLARLGGLVQRSTAGGAARAIRPKPHWAQAGPGIPSDPQTRPFREVTAPIPATTGLRRERGRLIRQSPRHFLGPQCLSAATPRGHGPTEYAPAEPDNPFRSDRRMLHRHESFACRTSPAPPPDPDRPQPNSRGPGGDQPTWCSPRANRRQHGRPPPYRLLPESQRTTGARAFSPMTVARLVVIEQIRTNRVAEWPTIIDPSVPVTLCTTNGNRLSPRELR